MKNGVKVPNRDSPLRIAVGQIEGAAIDRPHELVAVLGEG